MLTITMNNKLYGIKFFDNTEIVEKIFETKNEKTAEKQVSNGKFWVFYPSGVLKSDGSSSGMFGLANGDHRFYYGNGELESLYLYNNGKADGEFSTYYESGIIKSEGTFYKGKKHGLFEWYYETGELKETANYKNDKLSGEYIAYYKNGKIREIGKYKDGELNGEFESYFQDGTKRLKGIYKKGKLIDKSIKNFGNLDKLIEQLKLKG